MKKTVLIFALCGMACGLVSAQKLTVKNIFGADRDIFGDYDLLNQNREKEIDNSLLGQYYASKTGNVLEDTDVSRVFSIGDRIQADYKSSMLNGRLRLDMLYKSDDSESPKFIMAPTGFVHYAPVPYIGFAAGNNFYKYFAIPSAYLAAADDTTKYGRMLTDSIGIEDYRTYGDFGLYTTSFLGGITSDWAWGKKGKYYIKLAAGGAYYNSSNYALDMGINAGINKMFDVGFTAHDVTSSTPKYGAFAGLNCVPNLIFNIGFYYNFTSSEYLPEACVTRSDGTEDDNDIYKFKKQTAKYALGVSTGYNFKRIGLGIYGDLISGLTDEYLGEIKYYDTKYDSLFYTKDATIVRGVTCVKYKYNFKKKILKAKRTDGYSEGAIPLYAQFRVSYDASRDINASFNFKLRTMIHDSSQSWLTFFPNASINLPGNAGKISTGVRFDMNLTRYNGLSGISVPLTYTYTFKKDFRD